MNVVHVPVGVCASLIFAVSRWFLLCSLFGLWRWSCGACGFSSVLCLNHGDGAAVLVLCGLCPVLFLLVVVVMKLEQHTERAQGRRFLCFVLCMYMCILCP